MKPGKSISLLAVAALFLWSCAGQPTLTPSFEVFDLAEAPADVIEVTGYDFGYQSPEPLEFEGTLAVAFVNRGIEDHEFAIVEYDDGRYGMPVAEIEPLVTGQSAALVADLPPGEYRVVCLVVSTAGRSPISHLQLGMETELVVR